jgi:hypothetical protein
MHAGSADTCLMRIRRTAATLAAVLSQAPVTRAAADGAASLVIEGTCGIGCATTYVSNSFVVENLSTTGIRIDRIEIDFRSTILPDLLFDPYATAGDAGGKDYTIDTDPGVGESGHTFSSPHDGGYDILEVTFTDFDPGEQFGFSVDTDPTSINGLGSGPSDGPASVSGLELTGEIVTFDFSDGAAWSVRRFAVRAASPPRATPCERGCRRHRASRWSGSVPRPRRRRMQTTRST